MYEKNNKSRRSRDPVQAGWRGEFEYPWQPSSTRVETCLVKHSKLSPVQPIAVRTRRAYFDCKFGQLHVRTAFPTTGGFDEQVTLFCLHSSEGSSRSVRSITARDRATSARCMPPICLASANPIPPRGSTSADAAGAVSDLASDLRLRQIDVLGVRLWRRGRARTRGRPARLWCAVWSWSGPLLDRMPASSRRLWCCASNRERTMVRGPRAYCPTRVSSRCRLAADLFEAAPKTWRSRSAPFCKDEVRLVRLNKYISETGRVLAARSR